MSTKFTMDAKQVDELVEAMKRHEGNTENVVNQYLWNTAGERIRTAIMPLLPVSGRTWRGKKAAASSTNPFTIDRSENLAVSVKTTNAYHYLYFPDDGSTTRHHHGGQEFMYRGGEAASDEIVNDLIKKLVEEME